MSRVAPRLCATRSAAKDPRAPPPARHAVRTYRACRRGSGTTPSRPAHGTSAPAADAGREDASGAALISRGGAAAAAAASPAGLYVVGESPPIEGTVFDASRGETTASGEARKIAALAVTYPSRARVQPRRAGPHDAAPAALTTPDIDAPCGHTGGDGGGHDSHGRRRAMGAHHGKPRAHRSKKWARDQPRDRPARDERPALCC